MTGCWNCEDEYVVGFRKNPRWGIRRHALFSWMEKADEARTRRGINGNIHEVQLGSRLYHWQTPSSYRSSERLLCMS
jgi:hypothetical protein